MFCKSCGNRIDGKKVCPNCNFANEPDNTFCSKCGTRIDGKKFCKNCGTEIEGAFCTACGQKYEEQKSSTYLKQTSKTTQFGIATKNNVLEIIGSSILMMGALISLIFVFLIGLGEYKMSSSIIGSIGGLGFNLSDDNNIFYFFGKAYKDIAKTLDVLNSFSASFETGLYLPTILTTIVSATSVICCVTFTILAIVRFSKKLCGKEEKSPVLFALLSIAFYL